MHAWGVLHIRGHAWLLAAWLLYVSACMHTGICGMQQGGRRPPPLRSPPPPAKPLHPTLCDALPIASVAYIWNQCEKMSKKMSEVQARWRRGYTMANVMSRPVVASLQ